MLEEIDNNNWLANSYCGYRMTQMWRDFFLWEAVLNREQNIEAIIELGTAHGGFSLYLLHQAQHRQWDFHTYDVADPIRSDRSAIFGADGIGKCADLGTHFRQHDVLGNPEPVRELIREYGPIVLFCDNGNKAREVELYAEHTAPGSLIVVHDWNREIFPTQIPSFLTEIYGEECDTIESWTRFFRR